MLRFVRTAAVVLATALTVALVPSGGAQADHGDRRTQTYLGEVILPTRYIAEDNTPTIGFPGLGRRLWLAWAGGTNNLVSDVFTVDPTTWGGRFDLQLDGDLTGMADLGVFFYDDFGTILAVFVGDPGAPVTSAEYDAEGVGGEQGAIPAGATYGLVFMRTGLDALFTYTGYAPHAVHITGSGFGDPIEIVAGQKVVWTNEDTSPRTVTADASNDFGEPLFDSSPNYPNQSLGQGDSFAFTFFQAGTYTYTDRVSGATGSVVVVGEFGTPG